MFDLRKFANNLIRTVHEAQAYREMPEPEDRTCCECGKAYTLDRPAGYVPTKWDALCNRCLGSDVEITEQDRKQVGR